MKKPREIARETTKLPVKPLRYLISAREKAKNQFFARQRQFLARKKIEKRKKLP